MPSDADFDAVVSGTFEPNDCTPDVEADRSFRGIRIASPKRVPLTGKPDRDRSFARVMVVGAAHLDSNYLGLRERFLEHIHIAAVDVLHHRARSRPIEIMPNAIPIEPFAGMNVTDAMFAGRSVIVYFNVNLVPLLALPEVEAEYVIYATLGSYVSNTTRTQVLA
jgi:hypothetical protein